MTVSSTTNKNSYAGNGSTTVFPYTFPILAQGDILVQSKVNSTGVITTKTLTTDYTVSGAGSGSGGNVTMVVAPATGTTLILTRDVDLLQETDYTEYDAFPASSHETALDRLTMIAQQQQEQLDRSVKMDSAVTGVSATITGTPAAGNVIAVNSGATGYEFIAPVDAGVYSFPGSGTGLLVQSEANTAIVRTLTGTANELTVTDGNGVAGNPTVSLPTSLTFTGKTITGGSYVSATYNGMTVTSSTGTFTLTNGKTLAVQNSLTFSGTDASSVAFGTGGTVLYSGGALGTPSSGTLTNATGLPISTGVSGLAAGVAAFLATPSSANLKTAVTDETGSGGALVFATSPTLTTPTLGVASATSINFGGTALANYVEGTFTPTVTLVGGAGNTVPVYTTNSGAYTRIGNRVFVEILLTGDGGAEGAGTGTLNISLPVSLSTTTTLGNYVNDIGQYTNGATVDRVWADIGASGSTIVLVKPTTFANFTGADQNSTTRTIRLHFSYGV